MFTVAVCIQTYIPARVYDYMKATNVHDNYCPLDGRDLCLAFTIDCEQSEQKNAI